MPDARIRDLERTLAEGDVSVRPSLAREYMRLERPGAALAQLLEIPDASPDLVELEQRAWRAELADLQPTLRIDQAKLSGPRWDDRVWRAHLSGWFGGGRFAVLESNHPLPGLALGFRTMIFDLQEEVFGLDPEVGEYMESRRPLFVVEAGILACCDYDREHPFLISLTPDGVTEQRLGLVGRPLSANREGSLVLARSGIRNLDGDLVCECSAFPVLCWDLDLRASASAGQLLHGPILADALTPVAGIPGGLAPIAFLEDGRLVSAHTSASVTPSWSLVDVERGEAVPWQARDRVFQHIPSGAPLPLSSDGRLVLVPQSSGAPEVLPLGDQARARPWPPARRPPLWHPRADLFLRDEPESMLVSFAGEPLSILDPEVDPLGWTPDGRGLLVQRRGLELWTPRGAPLRS